jgi:hypothetical protein
MREHGLYMCVCKKSVCAFDGNTQLYPISTCNSKPNQTMKRQGEDVVIGFCDTASAPPPPKKTKFTVKTHFDFLEEAIQQGASLEYFLNFPSGKSEKARVAIEKNYNKYIEYWALDFIDKKYLIRHAISHGKMETAKQIMGNDRHFCEFAYSMACANHCTDLLKWIVQVRPDIKTITKMKIYNIGKSLSHVSVYVSPKERQKLNGKAEWAVLGAISVGNIETIKKIVETWTALDKQKIKEHYMQEAYRGGYTHVIPEYAKMLNLGVPDETMYSLVTDNFEAFKQVFIESESYHSPQNITRCLQFCVEHDKQEYIQWIFENMNSPTRLCSVLTDEMDTVWYAMGTLLQFACRFASKETVIYILAHLPSNCVHLQLTDGVMWTIEYREDHKLFDYLLPLTRHDYNRLFTHACVCGRIYHAQELLKYGVSNVTHGIAKACKYGYYSLVVMLTQILVDDMKEKRLAFTILQEWISNAIWYESVVDYLLDLKKQYYANHQVTIDDKVLDQAFRTGETSVIARILRNTSNFYSHIYRVCDLEIVELLAILLERGADLYLISEYVFINKKKSLYDTVLEWKYKSMVKQVY